MATTTSQEIVDLKTRAKNQRDRGLMGYPRARDQLNKAIELARDELNGNPVAETKRQLTRELADCYGMKGGVERRWGIEGKIGERQSHLSESCIAYDQGYRYEWDSLYGSPATYNLVNRLTGRLLIDPSLLEADDVVDLGNGVEPTNVRHDFSEALNLIVKELANRGNFWTESDLALLRVLLGQSDAATAYAPFLALSPPEYAFGSALDGLRPLAASGVACAAALNEAIELLASKRLLIIRDGHPPLR